MDYSTSYDATTKIWSGPPAEEATKFNRSIGNVILEQMQSNPNKICQIDDVTGRNVTNAEALQWSIRLAKYMEALGLSEQHVVAIIAKNTTYLMPVAVACLLNATPFHAINPAYDEKIYQHLLDITKPKLIFCDAALYDVIDAVTKPWQPMINTVDMKINSKNFVEDLLHEMAVNDKEFSPRALVSGGDQTMAILCSSGTTGLPKAVCISNRKLYTYFPSNSDDIVYSNSGIDWISGLVFFLLCTTRGCTRIISNKPYTPEYFVELLVKYGITTFWGAPRHVSTLLSCPAATPASCSSLRWFVCGGGFVAEKSLQDLQKLCSNAQILQAYGLTETGILTLSQGGAPSTAVGWLERGIRAQILDEEDRRLGVNETGRLHVHISCPWQGYYNNRAATLQMQNEETGWFQTGDIGYFDERGLLYIIDREKETLKNAGLQYWPTEIENIIAELPDVVGVCVVGVYQAASGDVAGALVKKSQGSKLSEREVSDYVAKRVPPFKQLASGVYFVEQLPHNANGKILRKACKEIFMRLAGDS